jgi:hypothetical protein
MITICWIRARNIRAREKRIKDWVKENKIIQGNPKMNETQRLK